MMGTSVSLFKTTLQRAAYALKTNNFRNKPLAVLRSLGLAAEHLFTSRNRLWFVNLSVTTACNLRCQHCFNTKFITGASHANKQQLTTEEYCAVVRELRALGVVSFEFQGGEVFLHPGLEQIIQACKPKSSFISIQTNGTLLTEEIALRLKNLGVDQINVSIDSGIPEEHDEFRGQSGTFKKAMKAIDIALQNGFKVFVCTTITHESLYSEGFNKIMEFCVNKGIVLWLLIGIPIGKWSGRLELLIDEKDHAYIESLSAKSNNLVRRDLSPRLFRQGCPSINESFYLTAYGDVLPCPFIHINIGNVREHYISDIINRALEIKKFKTNNPVCLIGQDRDFIADYGKETFTAADAPLDGEKIFGFKKQLPKRSSPLA